MNINFVITIVVSVIVGLVTYGLGFNNGSVYAIEEILKEIRIRRKMQRPEEILTEVIKVCYRIKEKGD